MTGPATDARGAAVRIIRELGRAGHTAYLAGGCVRDAQLGVEPKDYDVATEARPEVVRSVFKRSQYVGEAFGVVLVYINGHAIEVATFRSEWGYEDGRRPSGVEFTDAQHDAQRRDFTINGLFADPLGDDGEPNADGKDRIIDFVGGRLDLQDRVLRAIGKPDERFAEDYLRMLRAARFAARLGFTIDPETAEAIRVSAKHLGKISRERIGQEVMLMLTGPMPALAAGLIQSLELDGTTFNEDHDDVALPTLGALPAGSSYALSLAAWMLDRHGASGSLDAAAVFADEQAWPVLRGWRKALCLSNDDRAGLADALSLLKRAHGWSALGVAKRKRLLARPGWAGALALIRAVEPDGLFQVIEAQAQPLIAQGVEPKPWVTGDDLIGMGLKPGPGIGRLLDRVYDAQLDGRVSSRDEALAWAKGRL